MATWDVVARVLENDSGGTDAAEIGDSADLRVNFDAVNVS